jgi:MscS family membrane protein
MQILKEIVAENENLEDKVFVAFDAFNDFSLNINFKYYITKGKDILQTQTQINLEILRRFNAEGLEFAFPTQTIFANVDK